MEARIKMPEVFDVTRKLTYHETGLARYNKIKECMSHNLTLSKDSTILDENSCFLPSVVYMVELEVALNWLLWGLNDLIEKRQYIFIGRTADDIREDMDMVERYWDKQRNYCFKQAEKNKEFSSFHWRMTD